MAKKKLRVGVVGLGMGRAHLNGYKTHPDVEIVAVADTDKSKLAMAAEEYEIANGYLDAAKMLKNEKLDLVSIVVPNKLHKPLTLAALKAGCHVLCEKPMAMNAREAQQMIDAAKAAKKRLMINFSYRFNEQAWALKKVVDTGIMGDIYFGRTLWHRRRGMPGFGGWFGQKALAGGGPLIDLGVHRIDLALWLMDYPEPDYVMARTYNPIATRIAKAARKKFDVEDLAAGMITFKNGASLAVEASWALNTKENDEMETRLFGTKAGLVQKNIPGQWAFEAEIFTEKEGCQFDMKLHPPVPEAKPSMVYFADCILNNKPHMATGEEGLIVMKILDAMYASAAKGKPIKVG